MHPVLFRIGPLVVHTYGVLVASGFLAGITFAMREAKRVGQDPDRILDLCFYILVSAIIGARLLYIIVSWPIFVQDPMEAVRIWNGGLVFYGGFLGACLAAWWYVKSRRLPLWRIFDILAPSIPLGQSIGRIGCFFAGCCYGKVCDLPWAVTYWDAESLAPIGIRLHPVQLYSALNELVLFFVLVALRRHKHYDGQIVWTYVMLYGITRFVFEFFRGDERGSVFGGIMSTSQFIGVIMVAVAAAMLKYLKLRDART